MSDTGSAAISFTLNGATYRNSDAGRFVARCAQIHLSASGATAEEAETRWQANFFVFLESCRRRGTLLQILQKAGVAFTLYDASGKKLHLEDEKNVRAANRWDVIPLPLLKWGNPIHAGTTGPIGKR